MPHTLEFSAQLDRATQLRQMDSETRRARFIFIKCLLKTQRAYVQLDAHRTSMVRRNAKRGCMHNTPLTDALWEALCALLAQAGMEAKAVRERGHLLFAWEGTTVLQGGAA